MNTFSIQESLSAGLEFTKKNILNVGAVLLFVISLQCAFEYLNKTTGHSENVLHLVLSIITLIGFLIVYIAFILNVYKQGLRVVRGHKANLDTALEFPKSFWNYIGVVIISATLILLGFVMFIVPGLFLLLLLSFVKLLVVDKNLLPLEAIDQSINLTKDNLFKLFTFFLVIISLNILGFLFFIIGLLVTIPISFFAILHVYNKLLTPSEI